MSPCFRKRLSLMLLEHKDVIAEFCSPSRWKELSKETSSAVHSLLSPVRSSESTGLRKSLRCWFGSSDRSLWNEHPFAPTGWYWIEKEPHCSLRGVQWCSYSLRG
ncbi:hypothetical protein Tco_0165855 [Tanacetum coccineum]